MIMQIKFMWNIKIGLQSWNKYLKVSVILRNLEDTAGIIGEFGEIYIMINYFIITIFVIYDRV